MVASSATPGLLDRVTCPNCWAKFEPVETLWVASDHPSLATDAKLGEGHPRRFVADLFDAAGNAIDARGETCIDLACPECHLPVPRACLEMPPLMLSVFGRPGSGKSYFLAAMIWELRRLMLPTFNLAFSDADPALNAVINENIDSVFGRTDTGHERRLTELIRKTQETGDQYRQVRQSGAIKQYLQPMLYTARPAAGHRLGQTAGGPRRRGAVSADREPGRVLCLYDNAGESFLPGADRASSPVTRHLARSEALLFTFDPTQEKAFAERLRSEKAGGFADFHSQERVLQEAAKRVRQLSELRQTDLDPRPLIVVVTKSDAWEHQLDDRLLGDFWLPARSDRPGREFDTHALNMTCIQTLSAATRTLLVKHCGEIVSAAESFSADVTYLPISAVGRQTRLTDDTQDVAIRPEDTAPLNASLPALVAMAKSKSSNLIAAGRPKSR